MAIVRAVATADTKSTGRQLNCLVCVPVDGAGLRQAGLDKQSSLCQACAVVPSIANPQDNCCDNHSYSDIELITARLAICGQDCASLAARGSVPM